MSEETIEDVKQQLAERDAAFAPLKEELDAKSADLEKAVTANAVSAELATSATVSLQEATAKYKAAVVSANPAIPADLIAGDTVQEIDASLSTAQALVEKVKESVKQEADDAAIPAGAPGRTPPDLDAMTPAEKIRHGLAIQPYKIRKV